ncbi:hypothetical protein [Carboxylicivirga sp. N1Y90]|uniref:hypothetical protein n=1 Tax=Carboxylicivirga fragile TaxID=3417571 RepID=UPI003D33EE90|nr:hypothetical protein [Marinilabiliaceae bacterium N1Y90]
MKLLRKLIFSNIWISLSAVSVAWIQAYLFEYKLRANLIALIFLGTYTIYNYIYLASSLIHSKRMNQDHLQWLKRYKTGLIISSSLSLFVCLYLFIGLNIIQKTLLFIAGLLSLLYVFPNKTKHGLRWIPYLKTPSILITWLVVTTILPQIESQFSQVEANTIYFAIPFLLAWILIFDLRDYSKDLASIKTWPQKLGFSTTKFISLAFIVLAFILLILNLNNNLHQLISFAILCLYILAIIRLKYIPYHNYAIIFDGLPILWGFSLLLLEFLQ